MQFGRGLLPLFAHDPAARHLNHGGYGATPRSVAAAQERWRARMEANPTHFFMSELPVALREAAARLAPFVGTAPDRLAFVENASEGIATVAHALRLKPGDEVLATDHVYNAVRLMFRHVCERAEARFLEVPVGMPVTGPAQILDALRAGITPRTRLIVVDHIASATAVIHPLPEIVALARANGIPVLVDGAHGPGHLDVDVDALGADIYVGNCHKWLCAARGAAFIATRSGQPIELHPTVISHSYGQGFPVEFDKVGTRDPSAWLTVPDAIETHHALGGPAMRSRNRALARDALARLVAALGTDPGAPADLFGAMVTVRLPIGRPATRETAAEVMQRFWTAHRIVIPVMAHSGALWLRLSVPAYVDEDDIDHLIGALPDVLAPFH